METKKTKEMRLLKQRLTCSEERNERDESGTGKDNILKKLEELRLSVREPVLSEEQLKFDDRLQEDEIFFYFDNS